MGPYKTTELNGGSNSRVEGIQSKSPDGSRRLSAWTLEEFFRVIVLMLGGVGYVMLALAGQLSTIALLLFGLFYGFAFHPRLLGRGFLSARQVNLLSWFYVPVFLLDIFFWSHSFVPATLDLILAMLLLKVYQEKGDRDYFQIIILNFLLVLAASSLTIDFSFLVGFLLFLLFSLAVMITFEIRRNLGFSGASTDGSRLHRSETTAAEEDSSKHNSRKRPVLPPDVPTAASASSSPIYFKASNGTRSFTKRDQRDASRKILLISSLALIAIMVGSTFFFFVLPRFGTGYFSRVQNRFSVLSGFNDHIQLGGVGKIQLDSSIVMRVQFADGRKMPAMGRWRGVTLDSFDGKNWIKRARAKPVYFRPSRYFSIQEPAGRGELLSYEVLLEPCGTNYIFTLDRILSLEGRLFPLVYDPVDSTLLARPHYNQRLGYKGESLWSRKASTGPGNLVLSDLQRSLYLQLPALDSRIAELARRIAGPDAAGMQAARLERYLRENYRYSLEQADLDTPQPLASFLFERKKGHCEYFATAMTVMLRTLGIPARIVNGFQPGEFNEVAGDYIIRGSDAHSWVEAFFADQGWRTFDPTPATNLTPVRSAIMKTFWGYWDAVELFWGQWILPYDDVLQASLFSDLQSLTMRWGNQSRVFFLSRWREGARALWTWLRQAFTISSRRGPFWIAGLFGIAILSWGFFRLLGIFRWQIYLFRSKSEPAVVQATRIYREMLKTLRKKGQSKPFSLTPLEFSRSIPESRLQEQVTALTELYNRLRFSPFPAPQAEIQQAYQLLESLRHYRPAS